MTGASYLLAQVFPVAFAQLPVHMDTPAARAMLLAIALQESRCTYRRQIRGPARGFWQFEQGGGVKGVLKHPETAAFAMATMQAFQYLDTSVDTAYTAIEHHDPLACVFARLLLWTVPAALPTRQNPDESWRHYLEAWRPGKPHRQTWDGFYAEAWLLVTSL